MPMPALPPVTLLVVDDHNLFRRGLVALLGQDPGLKVVGEANALPQEPSMGAEDFAFMLLEKPGAYCFIANGDGDHRALGHGGGPCTLHNPSYDFNDQLLPLGATLWVKLAQRWLAQA